MNSLRSEHSRRRRFFQRTAIGVLASALLAPGLASAIAVDPPQPDFFWPYGIVQLNGENLSPAEQPVIALANGKACGEATTIVAGAGPGVPPGDAGKTVYVVDVLADGPDAGQRAGCGRPGDIVTLYFPAIHRIAFQQLSFTPGGQRADLEPGIELPFRLQTPMLAGDGVN